MVNVRALVLGAGLGAGSMYFFDTANGRRRRALVRDQRVHAGRLASRFLTEAWCDLQARVGGRWHELTARWENEPVAKKVLAERVRAKVGRHVHHAREVTVAVERAGVVTLRGRVAPFEREPLFAAIRRIPGVKSIDDGLESAHLDESPRRFPFWRQRPTPTTRLFAALATGIGLVSVAAARVRR
jgi:hypothetical protein